MDKILSDEKLLAKKEYQKAWRERNKEYLKKYNKNYVRKDAEIRPNQRKKYREENSEAIKNKKKEYYLNNKDKIIEKSKEYYLNNKKQVNLYKNTYTKTRKQKDELFKIKLNTRTLIGNTIRRMGYSKNNKTQEILGCSFDEFKLHLESKFKPWMTWNNYGNPKDGVLELNKTWDIDHIIPVSSAITVEELLTLNHYTNLQPLCSYTNRNIKRNNL